MGDENRNAFDVFLVIANCKLQISVALLLCRSVALLLYCSVALILPY